MHVVLFMLIKINSLLASKIHEWRENKFITNELLMLQKKNRQGAASTYFINP